jgi:hypothetical protein
MQLIYFVKNHLNNCTNQGIKNNVIFQIQQFDKIMKEYSKNVQILKATMTRTSPDKTSIEEENRPTEGLQIQNCIVSYHGRLIWKIDNIKNRLSKRYCSIEFSIYMFLFRWS